MPRSNKKNSWSKPPPKPPKIHTLLCPSSSESGLLNEEQTLMYRRAMSSGKKHGISLLPGTRTLSDGNCAFQAVISNVNERICFQEKFPMSPDYYRRIWVTDMKNRTNEDKTWKIYPDREWDSGWQEMMETGVYERGIFGDLKLFGISCGIKKVL